MADVTKSIIMLDSKLSSDNFGIWKKKIQMILHAQGIWDVANGTETKPTDATKAMVWEQKDAKAFSQIILNITDKEMNLMLNADMSAEVWTAVCNQFESKTVTGKSLITTKFYSLMMSPTDDLATHLSTLCTYYFNAINVGVMLTDAMFVDRILSSLNGVKTQS